MERGDRPRRYQGDGLDDYGEIEPTSDAAEDFQPGSEEPPDASLDQAMPPDADDELGQYEGSYEEIGITTDTGDTYGTGGGDVGIGGDVSPHGAMHDAAATEAEVQEDERLVAGSELEYRDVAERAEDMDLVAEDLDDQGVDQAWPVAETSVADDAPHSEFADEDEPYVDIRDDDELDDVA